MSFQRIGDGLPGLMAGWIDDPDLRWRVVERTWKRVAGEAVARHARPLALEGGTLRVEVDEPVWRRTLESMQDELIARLDQALGEDVIRDLRWCGISESGPQRARS